MTRSIWILLLSVVAAPIIAQTAPPASAGSTIVTAAQINGVWRTKNGEFKIWALGHQKLKVEFSGSYEYKSPQGPMANTGEGGGIADIDADTITFKPDGAEDGCAITMKYKDGRLRVSQEGICGFGHNVTAAGDYRRVSSSKPKFGED
jgi:hypothetical protein